MPSIAAAATVKILLGRGTRDWRMSFSLVVGGEVVDGVTALRVEAGDARDRVDAAREPAPGNEHDRVDGLGDQPARDGDDAFLNKLFEPVERSEEHTSELQSLMRISYAVFCLKKKTTHHL